jgi:hypothetical protein
MAKDTTTATKLSTLSEGGALAPLNLVPGKAGLVPVPPKELAIYDDVEALDDTGLGTVKGADRRIPILRILAGNSPQVTAELPGAKGGAILNTSTGQIYNGKLGLYIIACYLDKKYVKYIKRDDDGGGGGFVAVLEPEDPEVKQRQDERMAKEGNLYGKLLAGFVPEGKPGAGKPMELVETKYMYCVCVVPNEDGSYPGELGEIFEALIPFESTKIKAYDSWIERNKTTPRPNCTIRTPASAETHRSICRPRSSVKTLWKATPRSISRRTCLRTAMPPLPASPVLRMVLASATFLSNRTVFKPLGIRPGVSFYSVGDLICRPISTAPRPSLLTIFIR